MTRVEISHATELARACMDSDYQNCHVAPRGLERCPHRRHHCFGRRQPPGRTLYSFTARAHPQRIRLRASTKSPRTPRPLCQRT